MADNEQPQDDSIDKRIEKIETYLDNFNQRSLELLEVLRRIKDEAMPKIDMEEESPPAEEKPDPPILLPEEVRYCKLTEDYTGGTVIQVQEIDIDGTEIGDPFSINVEWETLPDGAKVDNTVIIPWKMGSDSLPHVVADKGGKLVVTDVHYNDSSDPPQFEMKQRLDFGMFWSTESNYIPIVTLEDCTSV